MRKKHSKEEVETAKRILLKHLKDGATVYCVDRNPKGRGAVHRISAIIMMSGEPQNVSGQVARVTGRMLDTETLAVRCIGGGMDMGFDLVDSLSRALGVSLKREWL